MEPIISLWENLTTNSELSENCWPDFWKKNSLSSPLMRLYRDNETTNQMEPKCGLGVVKYPNWYKANQMVILQALPRI